MFNLLSYTIGFSASDCLDPLAISVVIYLMTTKRPILNCLGFLLGVCITTFLAGLILSFGLIKEIDKLLSHPHGLFFAFQLMIGVLIALGGIKYWRHANQSHENSEPPIKIPVNPAVALTLGIAFTATDLPTNLPLIAVSDELVKTNATMIESIASCLAYSLVRISPALTIVGLYIWNKEKSAAVIEKIQKPIVKWGHKVTAIIILVLGIVLVADSLFYFATDKAILVFG